MIDPVKEATAQKIRLEMGLTTYTEEIARSTGKDFEDVIERLAQEKELLATP